ncbi:putative membrane protein [Lysobacter dokdonensis DS-58]|uniref:Putative membrane protein n=1 Tax=Lysobacter dokdonensis DS-58 TaxID=1300345 RepID=A0A0A2WI63_9GAMM|nr:phage holin family protein [Lysobacter dokdonensis]KGQ17945.1 putative membrane protein [Lysobacter dokdonensis DS-58]
MTGSDANGDGTEDGARERAAPGIADALKELGDTGKATWAAGREAATALRILVTADFSLARSAFGRTLAFTALAIIFGASAWLLLTAALIAWLSLNAGWAWWMSLLVCGVSSVLLAGLAGWMAVRYFEHTRMKATRRQLARLGIGELGDMTPDAGSGKSAKAAEDQVEAATENGKKKGLGVDVTPP